MSSFYDKGFDEHQGSSSSTHSISNVSLNAEEEEILCQIKVLKKELKVDIFRNNCKNYNEFFKIGNSKTRIDYYWSSA